ncbi:hypothetical protein CKAN_02260100 [Cinnamomum micranthum f. kanehirae]|uniref:Uncharacterized protein n=1 Tax=Cinnamomum micranthum f. kanehirae TaxID=337451 RepID=A0A3S4PPZ3_9MAGN|nr:hypothetical protein CKAN_02260100 [Cinnamomum micranthum f. kanehirae]
MAKSLRSKRKKRLRTLRREIVQPLYDEKEAAKLAVQEAALNAPKLPIPPSYKSSSITTTTTTTDMDVEMADGGIAVAGSFLKPVGGVGKKSKKKLKLNKRHGNKIRKKNI